MFGYDDNEETVEHFGKRKTKVKISGKAVVVIILVILAIALFAYLATKMDKTGATPGVAPAPAAASSSILGAKPATGGWKGRR